MIFYLQTVYKSSGKEIRSLSVDWVSKRLYVIDGTSREIIVMNYDGSRQKRIVSGTTVTPQSVAVDAHNRYVK